MAMDADESARRQRAGNGAPRGTVTVLCDVAGVAADVATVEALARLQLAARRSGRRIRLHHCSEELRALIALMGLDDVLRA